MHRVLFLLLLCPAPLLAEQICPAPEPYDLQPVPTDGKVEVTADRAEVTAAGDSMFSGGVTVTRGPQRLETEGASYDPVTGRVTVTGGARYRQPGLEVEAAEVEYLPAEGRAVLEDSRYELPQQPARGSAGRIEARESGRISMDEVTYTTCPGDEPDWRLKIDELRVYNEKGIGEAERVSLRFMGVPLLYWPYLSFPISDARKSGFLVPEFGQSERSGLEIKVPYYFNLAPNYDYTVAPTWLSKRGLQLANDFRYLGPQGGGEVQFDYLHEDDRRPDDGQRSYFRLDHVTRRDDGWRFVADIEDVSDTDYFQDLGSGVAITSQTHLERAVQAEHTGSVWRVLARAQNFRTLDLSIPADQRPYARLPQLLATASWREGVMGLDWRLRSEVTNFSRNVGEEGTRLHLEPSASWPVEGPGYFFVPSASMRFVNYQLTNRDPALDDSPDIAVPTLSLDSGLVFEREVSGNDFVQTLEPRLLYAWIPVRDQDELPVFDTGVPDFNFVQLFRPNRFIGADRIGDTNQLSVGLTSRVLDNVTGREFLTASIGKAWYFEDPEVTLPDSPPDEDSSPIVLELGMGLFNHWNADVGYQWSDVEADTRLAQFRVQYQPAANRVINLGYRYRPALLEDVGASFGWPLSDRWSAVGAIEYSLRDKATVNRLVGVQYQSCCWALRLGHSEQVSRRDGTTDDSYRLQIEFKGLAGIGSDARSRFEGDILGYSVYD